MARLFLSASLPHGERARAFEPFDQTQIIDAVTDVARASLRRRATLVFGAHPTISPLVMSVAAELGARGLVEIHQSRFYEAEIPRSTTRLADLGYGEFVWSNRKETKQESLLMMRQQMIDERPNQVSVFIGGMEGVIEEFNLASSAGSSCFAVTGPGGAARRLGGLDREVTVLDGPKYPLIADEIMSALP